MIDDPTAIDALVTGYARGVQQALRLNHPDLSWEVTVVPLDRAGLEAKEDADA